jgi:hypothetical protein
MNHWEIKVYCYLNSKGTVIRAFTELPKEPNVKYSLSSVTFKMRPLTWAFYADLSRRCANKGNMNDVDELLMRELKITEGICDWDLKDDKGEKIAVNKENIFNLHPKIVEAMYSEYDQMSYMTEKDRRTLSLNINKYYMSAIGGSGRVAPPLEVIELSLMEKFRWTPDVIADIPYKKIQEIFFTLNQREVSSEAAQQFKNKKGSKK